MLVVAEVAVEAAMEVVVMAVGVAEAAARPPTLVAVAEAKAEAVMVAVRPPPRTAARRLRTRRGSEALLSPSQRIHCIDSSASYHNSSRTCLRTSDRQYSVQQLVVVAAAGW